MAILMSSPAKPGAPFYDWLVLLEFEQVKYVEAALHHKDVGSVQLCYFVSPLGKPLYPPHLLLKDLITCGFPFLLRIYGQVYKSITYLRKLDGPWIKKMRQPANAEGGKYRCEFVPPILGFCSSKINISSPPVIRGLPPSVFTHSYYIWNFEIPASCDSYSTWMPSRMLLLYLHISSTNSSSHL